SVRRIPKWRRGLEHNRRADESIPERAGQNLFGWICRRGRSIQRTLLCAQRGKEVSHGSSRGHHSPLAPGRASGKSDLAFGSAARRARHAGQLHGCGTGCARRQDGSYGRRRRRTICRLRTLFGRKTLATVSRHSRISEIRCSCNLLAAPGNAAAKACPFCIKPTGRNQSLRELVSALQLRDEAIAAVRGVEKVTERLRRRLRIRGALVAYRCRRSPEPHAVPGHETVVARSSACPRRQNEHGSFARSSRAAPGSQIS